MNKTIHSKLLLFRKHLTPCKVVLLSILVASSILFPLPVQADVAPPHQPPGSSLGANQNTAVQMVAEQVTIKIMERETPPENPSGTTEDKCIAKVEATFQLLNQSKETEVMEVWFPLGVESGLGTTNISRNFQAWVGEKEAVVKLKASKSPLGQEIPSAIWQVAFPAGEEILLRVSYELSPEGYLPFGTFRYLLETGAGWKGNIQRADIVVQLPYEVNEYNTVLKGELYTPNPANFQINGKEIAWHFENFEPTASDNIFITVLAPPIWQDILTAKEQAEKNRTDPQAQFALAQALQQALLFKYELLPIGESSTLDQQADEAYQAAIQLAPNAIEIQKAYIDFLLLHWFGYSGTPPPPKLILALANALEQAPQDKDLLRYKQEIQDLGFNLEALTNEARLTASAPPPSPTLLLTATAVPSLTAELTPSPTVLLPPATATVSPPTAESERKQPPPCWGSLLLIFLPFALLVYRFKRQHN